MMQTFAGCIMGASIGGGFASYLTAMDYQSYLNLVGTPGNRPEVSYTLSPSAVFPCAVLLGALLDPCRNAYVINEALVSMVEALLSCGHEGARFPQVPVLF